MLHNRLPQEKYLKLKNLVTHFRSIFISEYSGQISQKIVDLHTLLIHLKRRDSLKKWVQVFALWRFINKSRLPRGICQLKKLPANEITESLAFTVCKLELCGKVILLQSRFRRTCFRSVVNNGQNRGKAMSNKTKRNWGAIAKAWLQRGNLDGHEIFDIHVGSLD